MNAGWQLAIALVLVAWAAFAVVRRTVRLWAGRRSAGSCATSACSGCPTQQGRPPAAPPDVIPLESLLERRQQS